MYRTSKTIVPEAIAAVLLSVRSKILAVVAVAEVLVLVPPPTVPIGPPVPSTPFGAERTANIFPVLVRMYTPFGVFMTRTVSPAGIFCGPELLAVLVPGMLMSV